MVIAAFKGIQIAMRKADTYCHAFRQVVLGDGEDEKPDAIKALGIWALASTLGVLMRHKTLESDHKRHPKAESQHDNAGRQTAVYLR